MKGGASLLDLIGALHAHKFLPGSGFDLLPHEENDLCNDLQARLETWTPSDPGCEAYDAFVRALALQALTDCGCATYNLTPPEVDP